MLITTLKIQRTSFSFYGAPFRIEVTTGINSVSSIRRHMLNYWPLVPHSTPAAAVEPLHKAERQEQDDGPAAKRMEMSFAPLSIFQFSFFLFFF